MNGSGIDSISAQNRCAIIYFVRLVRMAENSCAIHTQASSCIENNPETEIEIPIKSPIVLPNKNGNTQRRRVEKIQRKVVTDWKEGLNMRDMSPGVPGYQQPLRSH